jgi:cystinosin
LQKEFTLLHPKGELPVKLNDVFFSCHAILMNIVILVQCFLLERGEQKVSLPMTVLVGGLWVTILSCLTGAIMERISWMQFIYYLAYIKVGTTPIKYTPQVLVTLIPSFLPVS